MVKHIQTIRQLLLTNCLSVFDHFVGLAFKGLTSDFVIVPVQIFENILFFHAVQMEQLKWL